MTKTIMLACAGGFSTSLIVKHIQAAAAKEKLDYKVFATAAVNAEEELESEHPSVLMLGPQVRYVLPDLKKQLDIPVQVINMQDYGLMNGAHILHDAMKLMGDE